MTAQNLGPNSISTQWDRTLATILIIAYLMVSMVLILWVPPIPIDRIYVMVGIGGVAVVPTCMVLMMRSATIASGKVADTTDEIAQGLAALLKRGQITEEEIETMRRVTL